MRLTVSRMMSHFASKVTSREGFDAMLATRRMQLEGHFAKAGSRGLL